MFRHELDSRGQAPLIQQRLGALHFKIIYFIVTFKYTFPVRMWFLKSDFIFLLPYKKDNSVRLKNITCPLYSSSLIPVITWQQEITYNGV